MRFSCFSSSKKSLFIQLLLFFCMVILLQSTVWANIEREEGLPFNRRDILKFEEIKDRILKFYPPEHYHYIFVGRSLTMVRALMDLQNISNTGLPFNGKSIDLSFSSSFGQELEESLRLHFEEYLPDEINRAGKEFVLLDFTSSGAGLLTARKALNWYYQNSQPLHLLRVTTTPSLSLSKLFQIFGRPMDRTIVIDEDSMMARHFFYSNFDHYAGYGSFNIETGRWRDRDQDNAERYQTLLRWIRSIHPIGVRNSLSSQFCGHLF